MKFEYDATIESIAEPQVRLYLRSAGYRKRRIFSIVRNALVCGLIVFFVSHLMSRGHAPIVTIMVTILIIAIEWFCHEDLIRRRIVSHVGQEIVRLGDEALKTIYRIDSERIRCERLGAEISFRLTDYSGMKECEEFYEFGFGDFGICLVPKVAFDSNETKEAFLAAIGEKQFLHSISSD